jgi:hypothetical protein
VLCLPYVIPKMSQNDVARNGLKFHKIQKRVSDFYSKMFIVVSNSYGHMKKSVIYFSFVNLHTAFKCVHLQTKKIVSK